MQLKHHELRTVRVATRRTNRSCVELLHLVDWHNSAESIEVTQRDDRVYKVTKGLSLRIALRLRFR